MEFDLKWFVVENYGEEIKKLGQLEERQKERGMFKGEKSGNEMMKAASSCFCPLSVPVISSLW